jgi:oligoendopeptidase F
LYKNTEEWNADYDSVSRDLSQYNQFRGRLGESKEILLAAIEFDLSISRRIEKLYTFAHLKSDQDKTDSSALALLEHATMLHTKAGELSSYIVPEIQMIPDEILKSYLADPKFNLYGFHFEKLLRFKPHTRSPEVEELLAGASDVLDAASDIFGQLDNADLNFGEIIDHQETAHELSHGNFISFLMSPNPSVRKNAFKQYYKQYDAHKHSIAASFASSLKKDRFKSKARYFASSRQAALFTDNVEEIVYDNLIQSVRGSINPLVKYLNFRRETLGLKELHFYDTYCPLVGSVQFKMSYQEAVETCVAALSVLGEEYTSVLKQGLLGGWVDRYENRGKRSGAYSSGCPDSYPYILLNYEETNINSLYTLIHEAGHSMHSYFSWKNQPYVYSNYAIFVAEVASTFNEILLSDYLLKKYQNNNAMRSYILNREIDDIRGTLIRQTMFADFEKVIHQIADNEEAVTLKVLREEYRKLLETYFGGAIIIDSELELEALRIPHFYRAFYVYKYATGISAAIALAKKVTSGCAKSREQYLKFLSLGGSHFPVEELKIAGVDMTNFEPVNRALEYFRTTVDEFIATF